MTQNAIAVANFFINKGISERNLLSPMKVQKLVYIAHGWHLAITDEDLISDEIGAWPFGPVIGSIYKKFAKYSRKSIDQLAQEGGQDLELSCCNEDTLEILNKIWEQYKIFSASALSNMTHKDGSPWSKSYEEGKSNTIDNDLIKNYYKEKLS